MVSHLLKTVKSSHLSFPHRESEFRDYTKYIEGLFAAKQAGAHGKVLLLNQSVQNQVRGGQNVLLMGSKILAKPFCIPTESNIAKEDQADLGELTQKPRERKTKFAEGLTLQKVVDSVKTDVSINTTVSSVEKEVTENQTAKLTLSKNYQNGMTPRYLRFNLWDPSINSTRCTSDWTKTG
jgi:hypothetical protein